MDSLQEAKRETTQEEFLSSSLNGPPILGVDMRSPEFEALSKRYCGNEYDLLAARTFGPWSNITLHKNFGDHDRLAIIAGLTITLLKVKCEHMGTLIYSRVIYDWIPCMHESRREPMLTIYHRKANGDLVGSWGAKNTSSRRGMVPVTLCAENFPGHHTSSFFDDVFDEVTHANWHISSSAWCCG